MNIDLNADLGEGGESDESLMALVSSVNIACGGHAGNEETIRRAVELALQTNVAIGAHPGYEDPEHFGRRPMNFNAREIRDLIHRQLERMLAIHPQLHHVKPHGALYNQANQDETTADALVNAISACQPETILYCPPNGALTDVAIRIGMRVCAEGFIDRRYLEDGNLCPRSQESALIESPEEALSQALQIATQQTVRTLNGTNIPLPATTLCVHGDSPNALQLLHLTRSSLEENGIQITAP